MPNEFKKSDKYIDVYVDVKNKEGKVIGTIKRIGKIVKVFKNVKYKYKVKIAPKTYIYLEKI